MEKIMEYLLEKMDWEKNDQIDAIYLIDKMKSLIINDQQTQLYIKGLIENHLDNKMASKYIDVALNHIKMSELSSLLHISEMEAKYKAQNDDFTILEYEKLKNVGLMYVERNKE